MTKQDISALLDNPTELLQRLYDTVYVDLPDAIASLREARLNKASANLNYDEAYRKAQLVVQKEAMDKGEKMTVAERELRARNDTMEYQTAMETGEVVAAAAADVVFLLKDQKDALNTLVMWKMAEMKFTPSLESPNKQVGEEPVGEVPDWAKEAGSVPPDLQF